MYASFVENSVLPCGESIILWARTGTAASFTSSGVTYSRSYMYAKAFAVTESVKSAVLLYFADPSQFNDGYLYFYGNGSQNIFYK